MTIIFLGAPGTRTTTSGAIATVLIVMLFVGAGYLISGAHIHAVLDAIDGVSTIPQQDLGRVGRGPGANPGDHLIHGAGVATLIAALCGLKSARTIGVVAAVGLPLAAATSGFALGTRLSPAAERIPTSILWALATVAALAVVASSASIHQKHRVRLRAARQVRARSLHRRRRDS